LRNLSLFISLGLVFGLRAQSGALITALGGNEANTDAAFGMANQPASVFQEKYRAGLWMQQRFTGTNINNGGFCFATKAANTTFGADMAYRGTTHFNSTGVHISVAQQFNPNFSAGFSVGWSGIRQDPGYDRPGRLTGKIGTVFRMNEKWDASAVIINPWLQQDAYFSENPAAAISIGYISNQNTKIWAQFRYSSVDEAIYGIAFRHTVAKKLHFMGALQSGPEPISAGVEFIKNNIGIALSSRYHAQLGFSPSLGIHWLSK
jgi:hypothetical protein